MKRQHSIFQTSFWTNLKFNPSGTKGFGTHTKHQGEGWGRNGPLSSISRTTTNATNLRPWGVKSILQGLEKFQAFAW